MVKSVIIVEKDKAVRFHLINQIVTAPGMHCLGAYENIEIALPQVITLQLDVVFVDDASLFNISNISETDDFRSDWIPTQAIILMVADGNWLKPQMATTSCYLIRTPTSKELAETVRDLNAYIHRSALFKMDANKLSPRQKEILALLATGITYVQIGDKLAIGEETVRTHVKNICKKMNVRNRLQAIAKHQSKR